jgi:hypothetical protein
MQNSVHAFRSQIALQNHVFARTTTSRVDREERPKPTPQMPASTKLTMNHDQPRRFEMDTDGRGICIFFCLMGRTLD